MLFFFIKALANKYAISEDGIDTIIPIIITLPIWSSKLKLPIIAIGPGVGGINVWEEYNPPDNDKFRLVRESEDEDAIDLEIPFKIKNAESQKTTVPIKSPSILSENKDLLLNEFKMIFPNFFIEFVSFKTWPIIQLKKISNPIPFIEFINPSNWNKNVFNNPISRKIPSEILPINKLRAGFNLNFVLNKMIIIIDRNKYNKINIILYSMIINTLLPF